MMLIQYNLITIAPPLSELHTSVSGNTNFYSAFNEVQGLNIVYILHILGLYVDAETLREIGKPITRVSSNLQECCNTTVLLRSDRDEPDVDESKCILIWRL